MVGFDDVEITRYAQGRAVDFGEIVQEAARVAELIHRIGTVVVI